MASNLTKEERLAVHQNDLSVRAGSTLADHTALANPPAGGRFAPHSPKPTIVKGAHDYPKQPPHSPWSNNHLPDEPLIDATDCGPTFDGRSTR
jgi:hypothetical protein